jgi:hypothetical protein
MPQNGPGPMPASSTMRTPCSGPMGPAPYRGGGQSDRATISFMISSAPP